MSHCFDCAQMNLDNAMNIMRENVLLIIIIIILMVNIMESIVNGCQGMGQSMTCSKNSLCNPFRIFLL